MKKDNLTDTQRNLMVLGGFLVIAGMAYFTYWLGQKNK